MPLTVVPALALPATSVAGSLVTTWLAPSPLISLLVGQSATPESVSVQVKSTITSPPYQPEPLALVVGRPVTVGGVRSILIPVTTAGSLMLPALSLIVTGPAPRFDPSPPIVDEAG